MSFLSDLAPEAASRVLSVIALGALTTAAAGVGTAALLTGSTNPSAWLAGYQLSRECHQDGAASDPKCSSAAVQALAEQNLAARLEREAKDLNTPAAQSPQNPAPETRSPASSPPLMVTPAHPAPARDDTEQSRDD